MIENIRNRTFEEKKRRKRFVFILPFVIILVVAAVIGIIHTSDLKTSNSKFPTISTGSDNGYTNSDENIDTKIVAVSGFNFKSDTKNQEVRFENDRGNHCDFKISLYLADGTLLYESDYLKPGKSITEIVLLDKLDKGVYKNAHLVYRCYSTDSSHKALTQSDFSVEISVYDEK